MAVVNTFDQGYPQNPWANLETKTLPFYVHTLYREYAKLAVFNRFVTVRFNMNGLGAESMHLDTIIPPHANHNSVDNRARWIESSQLDTKSQSIAFQTYMGKLSFGEYDDLINRYVLDNKRGLMAIIQSDQGLAYMMTWTLDRDLSLN
jgi:hypothetical protein